MTATIDYWQIKQKGIVGILAAYRPCTRLSSPSPRLVHPNVVRDPANAGDVAFFAGTGISRGPYHHGTGSVHHLLPQTVRGLDLGFYWTSPKTRVGKFDFALNTTRLLKFSRPPGPTVDHLVAARAAGDINAATPLPETQNLIEFNGRPKWRATSSPTWSIGAFQVGGFARYTGPVNETGFVDANGTPWRVKSQLTANLYGQVTLRVRDPMKAQVRWRVGVATSPTRSRRSPRPDT